MDFLRNLEIDRSSFWIGFLAGFLMMWLLGRLRPGFTRMVQNFRTWVITTRQSATAGADIRLRNAALSRAQSMHIAAPLFPLDDLLIPPKLLAPPPPVIPGDPPPSVDITHLVLPYQPDVPELAARYRAPVIMAAEALENGTSLVVIGQPGSGKTVCLAHLASQIARREALPGGLEKLTPLLLHATDLPLPPVDGEDPLNALVAGLSLSAAAKAKTMLKDYLEWALTKGRALLILDGLDELVPGEVDAVVSYLKQLKERYPAMRIAASASLDYFDGLARLGCVPLAVAGWDRPERAAFVQRWNEAWQDTVPPQLQEDHGTEPALINAWLIGTNAPALPLEIALKTWAAYAGDQLGPSFSDAMEAYLRRMVYDTNMQPDRQARPALEKIALQALITGTPAVLQEKLGVLPRKIPVTTTDAGEQADEPAPVEEVDDEVVQQEQEEALPEALRGMKRVKVAPSLPLLQENGLLVPASGNRLRFLHPAVCSYLAGYSLSQLVGVDSILSGKEWYDKPGWDIRTQTAAFAIACGNPLTKVIENLLAGEQAPLHQHIITAARLLRYAPADIPWRPALMRRLAVLLQDTAEPLALRTRLVAVMVASGTGGIQSLLHQLCDSSLPELRQVAALGAGLFYDEKIAAEKNTVDRLVADLNDLLFDPVPNVSRAASLALAAIGNRPALEYLADALLSGDDELRKSAAEALANHPEEGYPTLREGTKIEDIMVRRAVIFGLQRVNQPWAVKILEEIQIEEEEWLVKNAATQALETIELPIPYLPQLHPPLTETAWLIEFAGEKGIGVSPGRPAVELLLRGLQEGSEEQTLAAMDYLRMYGDELAITPLYNMLYNTQGEVQDAAYNTLWHLAAAGLKLPNPEQVFSAK